MNIIVTPKHLAAALVAVTKGNWCYTCILAIAIKRHCRKDIRVSVTEGVARIQYRKTGETKLYDIDRAGRDIMDNFDLYKLKVNTFKPTKIKLTLQ